MVRLENVLKISLQDVLKTSWRRLENVLKTSWRRMAKTNILVLTKTFWRRLEDVFWRRMTKENIFVLIKTSWKRLLKTKTKDIFKTFSRRLHQDECLLGSNANVYMDKQFYISFKIILKKVFGLQNTRLILLRINLM